MLRRYCDGPAWLSLALASTIVLLLLFPLSPAAPASAKTPVGKLVISPRILKFPTTEGGTSKTLSFTLFNKGTAELVGSVGTPSTAQFVVIGGSAFSIEPGGNLPVSVEFLPPRKGTYRAKLPITVTNQKKPFEENLVGVATPAPSGTVLVAGGWINTVAGTASTEIYNSVTGRFTPGPNMNDSRGTPAASWLDPAVVSGAQAGEVLISGGEDTADNILGSTQLFDPATNSLATGPGGAPRAEHTSTLLASGQVLLDGGLTFFFSNIIGLNDQELYDPVPDTITTTGAMNDARGEQTATLIEGCGCPRDGMVLVTGGIDDTFDSAGFAVATATAELYDPSSGTFSCVGGVNGSTGFCNATMSVARWEHEATLLHDGTVLITGGITTDLGGRDGTTSADLYDPVSNTISPVGNMNVAREGHTATLIEGCNCAADGEVLVAGGQNATGAVINSAELYDPASKTFHVTGSMKSPRATHDATAFAVGDLAGFVLITGGYAKPGGKALPSAELYNPFTGKFVPTGSMKQGRYEHAAALIPPP